MGVNIYAMNVDDTLSEITNQIVTKTNCYAVNSRDKMKIFLYIKEIIEDKNDKIFTVLTTRMVYEISLTKAAECIKSRRKT